MKELGPLPPPFMWPDGLGNLTALEPFPEVLALPGWLLAEADPKCLRLVNGQLDVKLTNARYIYTLERWDRETDEGIFSLQYSEQMPP